MMSRTAKVALQYEEVFDLYLNCEARSVVGIR